MSAKINDGFETLLAQANECLKRAGEALNLAIEGMPPGGDFQINYIRWQAAGIASVVLDVNLLLGHGRFENVVGLCRIGFESRINLYAAMRVPGFAAQKYLAAAKIHAEELEEMISDGETSSLFSHELEAYNELLKDLRRLFGGIEEKPWSKFKDVAKAAGLMQDYEAHYPTMSKGIHNTVTGLAAKTDDRILIPCVLNLLRDAFETCAALAFFQIPGKLSPQPLTTKWKELADQISTFHNEYGRLHKKMTNLTNETFRHPEN